MSRAIVPINDINARLPEQGRIRAGRKGDKGQPQKIACWRFTSSDREALEQIAKVHGGDVVPWNEPSVAAGQFEVFTKTKTIPIVLPPNPLGGSPIYECWNRGGIERRCDGVMMQVSRATPDGAEMVDEPCACAAEKRLLCKVTTRLNVVLRDVRFGGTWRVESHGWAAAHELPGMAAMIGQLQSGGLSSGLLVLSERRHAVNGQTRRYMVPSLAVEHSVAAIASGAAQLGALAPAPTQALTAGPNLDVPAAGMGTLDAGPAADIGDGSDWIIDNDDVADAELVDKNPSADPVAAGTTAPEGGGEVARPPEASPPPPLDDPDETRARMMRRMHALIHDVRERCDDTISADDWRHGMVRTTTKGTKSSSADLDDVELKVLIDLLEDLKEGRRRLLGFDETFGRMRLTGPKSS